ncbi:phosphotransferase enzyme family protein [Tropicimonas marinistellae]|uniref:phosphotransferase enzyme family protein n=1 Tax=Tropicimonas marinistellae TaxID=1739787 RepID=UPI00082C3BF7|nr:phosphotransferase [Tropicimonas marinistellae]
MSDLIDSDFARAATSAWGHCVSEPRLVAHRENTVFDVLLSNGTRAAMRIHRRDSLDLADIETELIWSEALSDAGTPCPRPIRTVDGALVARWSDRLVTMVRWIDAPPVSHSQADPLSLMYRLGSCLAAFHMAADGLSLCPVPRRTWKSPDLIGGTPRWGGFWENSTLDKSERSFLLEARNRARTDLGAISHPDVGLIHADTLRENVLDDGRQLWLIDFDDSGWGYRGYDLGTALVQMLDSPNLSDRRSALVEGYLARRPGADGTVEKIPLFILIRGLVTAGWIVSRAPRDDPRQRLYAERALAAARLYLSG